MSKMFFSFFMVALLIPVASAGQDAAGDCRALVPNGWSPALEQVQTFIEDELAAKTGKSQRFLTQTSQNMAELSDAQLFIAYVRLMQSLDDKERRDLFNEQKCWLGAREQSALAAVDAMGGSLEPLEFSETFRRITEERLAVIEMRLSDKKGAAKENRINDRSQP